MKCIIGKKLGMTTLHDETRGALNMTLIDCAENTVSLVRETGQRISRLRELFDKYRAEKKLPRVSLFSAKHATWNTEVRKKRNASVHMWQHFKKADAEKAFHAAQSYIRFIEKIGDEILK
jgi:ribosomal protein L3